MAEFGGIINYVDGVRKIPAVILNHTTEYSRPSFAKTLKVQCFPVYSVLRALGLPTVDYFSLDVEGAEYEILKTIPFQDVNINLIGLEVEHAGKIFEGSVTDIKKLLKDNGYQYVAKTRFDKFFMKNDMYYFKNQ